MKLSIVWIDQKNAKLFHLSEEKMERQHVEASHTDHHTHRRDQFDTNRSAHPLFLQTAELLGDSDRILIVGPGVAKHHFFTYLAEHQPLLSKKIAGIETVDHPTDGQIAALTRTFFQRTG
jgi:stalled ribosome rescue protein Dom34